jgi:gas vesicle protein
MAKKGGSKFLIGAGVAAAVAAGLVGFFTQTKKGKELAKQGKDYAEDIAKRVAKEAEKMKKHTQAKYDEIVDDVVAEYQKKRKITKAAADDLSAELKSQWTKVRRELKK